MRQLATAYRREPMRDEHGMPMERNGRPILTMVSDNKRFRDYQPKYKTFNSPKDEQWKMGKRSGNWHVVEYTVRDKTVYLVGVKSFKPFPVRRGGLTVVGVEKLLNNSTGTKYSVALRCDCGGSHRSDASSWRGFTRAGGKPPDRCSSCSPKATGSRHVGLAPLL